MVEIFTPYLLIILGWNDLSPDSTMAISHELHISEQVCMEAGTERLALIETDRAKNLEKFKVERLKTEAAKYFCVPQPRAIRKHRPSQDDQ